MPQRIVDVDRQREVPVLEGIVHTAGGVGRHVPQQEHVLVVDLLAAVRRTRRPGAVEPFVVADVLAAGDRTAVRTADAVRIDVVQRRVGLRLGFDDVGGLVAVDAPHAFADSRAAETESRLRHRVPADTPCILAVDVLVPVLVGERQHLVHVERVGEVGRPGEVLALDVHRREFHLGAVEAYRTDVLPGRAVTRRIGQRDAEEQVGGLLVVIVGHQADAVVEESHVDADVQLVGGLPFEPHVGQRRGQDGARTVVDRRCAEPSVGIVKADVVVTSQAVRGAYLEAVEIAHVPEFLLRDHPAGRRRREISPAVSFGEFRRAVGAEREHEEVLLLVVIVQTPEIGGERLVGVGVRPARGVRPCGQRRHLVRIGARDRQRKAVDRVFHVVEPDRALDRMILREGLAVVQVALRAEAVGLPPLLVGAALVGDCVARQALVVDPVIVVIGNLHHGAQPVDDFPFEVEIGRHAACRVVARIVTVEPCGRDGRVVGSLGGRAVIQVVAVRGGHEHAAAHGRPVGGDTRRGERVALRFRVVEHGRRLQVPEYLERGVAVEGETREIGVDADAAVLRVAGRRGILHLVVAAVHADVVVHPVRVVEPLLLLVVVLVGDQFRVVDGVDHHLPACGDIGRRIHEFGRPHRIVAVADTGGVGARQDARAVGVGRRVFVQHRAHRAQVVAAVHQVEPHGGRSPCGLRLECHLRAPCHTALLGRDEDYAVRGAGTVDTRRSGVLQHLDRLDVIGVQAGHFTVHAIDDNDRSVRLVDRRTAANQEHGVGTRLVVGRRYAHAADTSLQGIADGVDRCAGEFLAVHLRNCGRDRAARLRAVADHHHVVHHQRILFEHNVDRRAGAYGHLLFLVAYEAEFERRIGARLDRIAAVGPGCRAGCGSLHDDGGADHRFALRIPDRTRYEVALRLRVHPAQHQSNYTYTFQKCRKDSFHNRFLSVK